MTTKRTPAELALDHVDAAIKALGKMPSPRPGLVELYRVRDALKEVCPERPIDLAPVIAKDLVWQEWYGWQRTEYAPSMLYPETFKVRQNPDTKRWRLDPTDFGFLERREQEKLAWGPRGNGYKTKLDAATAAVRAIRANWQKPKSEV